VFNAPTAAAAGSPTGFDGSRSRDPSGTITGYSWDFGDGSTPGTGVTPQHTYANAGTYAVKLTVTSNAGKTGTATHLVTVAARGTKTTTPPRLSGESISPRALVAERGSGSSATARSKPGARVTFMLSEAATVTFTIQRKTSGRKHGRDCVKQTSSNRTRKRCARLVVAGTFTRAGASGSNSFHFTGRANGRPLARGSYALSVVATDAAGNVSKPTSRPFRVIG
jgi:PKD repeat protein